MDQQQQQQLIQVWRELFEEMRYYVTFFLQIIVGSLLFLAAYGAIMSYVEEAKLAVWVAGFIGAIVVSIFIWKVGNQQAKLYSAVLKIQKAVIPRDFQNDMNKLIESKKPVSSVVAFRVFAIIVMIGLWVYMGYVTKVHEVFIRTTNISLP